jgi:hypothetical protein
LEQPLTALIPGAAGPRVGHATWPLCVTSTPTGLLTAIAAIGDHNRILAISAPKTVQ